MIIAHALDYQTKNSCSETVIFHLLHPKVRVERMLFKLGKEDNS